MTSADLSGIAGVTRGARLRALAGMLPYVLTGLLFAVGVFALYRLLGQVDLRTVMSEFRAVPVSVIGLCVLVTLVGYAGLIGYDWSALRHIGKPLPLPTVALGGFLGYAFGNTIGLSALSGGAVRYRIYAALGLTAYDIAAIAAFASVAYGIGATVIGLAALVVYPGALGPLIPLPPSVIRLVAFAAIAGIAGIFLMLSVRKASVTIRGFTISAPSPSVLAWQVVFTAVDVLMAATVLYLLMPPGGQSYGALLAVFAAATMAGVVSHVPGGIGVFESVVLAAVPAGVPLPQAAAALLLFRIVYFLIPFGLALVILSLNEMRLALGWVSGSRMAGLDPVLRNMTSLVPMAMAAMVFASGAFMIIASVTPALSNASEALELILPVGFVESGALLSSVAGVALLVLAHGLVRRLEGAYWLATLTLAASVVFSLLHGLDYERALLLGFALLLFVPCRREFYRRSRITRDILTPQWFLLVGLVLFAGVFTFLIAHKSPAVDGQTWWQIVSNDSAPRALRAGMAAAVSFGLLGVVLMLRSGAVRAGPPSGADMMRAAAIVADQDNPEANLVFSADKSLLFSDSGRSFLMFGQQGRTWIAFGDPVGDPSEAAELCWRFRDAANVANARPVFYEVSTDNLPLWVEMGLALHKMGEEAIVPLAKFGLDGADRKRLRASYARAGRDGLTLDLACPPHNTGLMTELSAVSDAWLADKKTAEKRFSVGRFDPDYVGRFELALVRRNGRVVAFANILATGTRRSATIDLMRHLPDAPSGTMEFLFTALMLALKARGLATFSLGMAPLAGLEQRGGAAWTGRVGGFVFAHGGGFYNFAGLQAFKAKFDPEWQPRYLAAPPRVPLVLIAADAAILIAGGVRKLAAH